MQAYLEKLRGL